MTPVMQRDETGRMDEAKPLTMPPATPRALSYADRQGIAMAWLGMGLGMFLLLGGLALGAALAFHAGFGGWLVTLALMGLVVVAALAAVNQFVMRPPR